MLILIQKQQIQTKHINLTIYFIKIMQFFQSYIHIEVYHDFQIFYIQIKRKMPNSKNINHLHSHQHSRDPYSHQHSRDPYSHQHSRDPYSHQHSRDPHSHQHSRDPHSHQHARDPHSHQHTIDKIQILQTHLQKLENIFESEQQFNQDLIKNLIEFESDKKQKKQTKHHQAQQGKFIDFNCLESEKTEHNMSFEKQTTTKSINFAQNVSVKSEQQLGLGQSDCNESEGDKTILISHYNHYIGAKEESESLKKQPKYQNKSHAKKDSYETECSNLTKKREGTKNAKGLGANKKLIEGLKNQSSSAFTKKKCSSINKTKRQIKSSIQDKKISQRRVQQKNESFCGGKNVKVVSETNKRLKPQTVRRNPKDFTPNTKTAQERPFKNIQKTNYIVQTGYPRRESKYKKTKDSKKSLEYVCTQNLKQSRTQCMQNTGQVLQKLNFNQNTSTFERILEEKFLKKEYEQIKLKYLSAIQEMKPEILTKLKYELSYHRSTIQAVHKRRLLSIMMVFFQQFQTSKSIKYSLIFPQTSSKILLSTELFPCPEQIVFQDHLEDQIEIILNFFIKQYRCLPQTLIKTNAFSQKLTSRFFELSQQLDETLNEKLEHFLVKKTSLYKLLHSLNQYIRYLLANQLVDKTQRLNVIQSRRNIQVNSSRSKREKIKSPWRNMKKNCDSERKITPQIHQQTERNNSKKSEIHKIR